MHCVIVTRWQQQRRTVAIELGSQLCGQRVKQVAVLLRRQRRMRVSVCVCVSVRMMLAAAVVVATMMRRRTRDRRTGQAAHMLLAALGFACAVASVAAQGAAKAFGRCLVAALRLRLMRLMLLMG